MRLSLSSSGRVLLRFSSTWCVSTTSTPIYHANSTQGTGDNFYKQGQLLPENFIKAAKDAGNDKGIDLRMQPDYDHSYYFMASFADEHVAWAAKHLGA